MLNNDSRPKGGPPAKGLSDQQRQALLLLADLLDRTTHRRAGP